MKTVFVESSMPMPTSMVILPLRCTVFRLNTAVVMISPIDFTPLHLQQIAELGIVTHLVAPSVLHHSYLKRAMELFPGAEVWGVPGVERKREDVQWTKLFGRDLWPFESELASRLIEGVPDMSEVAFFDRSGKTLIVTDLCFNLRNPKGWAAPLMLRLLGTHKKFAVSRLVTRFMKDRVAFERSMKNIFSSDKEESSADRLGKQKSYKVESSSEKVEKRDIKNYEKDFPDGKPKKGVVDGVLDFISMIFSPKKALAGDDEPTHFLSEGNEIKFSQS
ncbi:MAG: DUF4336 domain-containing protein, partial [Bdellovibrionota bacterium]